MERSRKSNSDRGGTAGVERASWFNRRAWIYLVECIVILMSALFIGLWVYDNTGVYDWERLRHIVGDVTIHMDNVDYMYDFMDYKEKRTNDAIAALDEMYSAGILLDKYYDYLYDGIVSDYFLSVCAYDYEDYMNNASIFYENCSLLRTIAETNELEYKKYFRYDGCQFSEWLIAYVNSNSRNEDYFTLAHGAYHELIKHEADNLEISESDLEYYYEAEIATNPKYIESIDVELKFLTAKNTSMNENVRNWWFNSSITSAFVDKLHLGIENARGLEYLNLELDADLYDDAISQNVEYLMYALGDTMEGTGALTVVNITGIDDWEDYVDKVKAAQELFRGVTDTQMFLALSISERYEGEQLYIVYDVKSCKHTEDIPTRDELIATGWLQSVKERIVESSLVNYLDTETDD